MAKDVSPTRAATAPQIGALSPLLREELRAELRAELQADLAAALAEVKRATPRAVFNGDDALFLAWMAGFVAGAHSAKPGDTHAVEIFSRARQMVDKLSPIASAGNGS
jgi:hypothetical protein